MLRDSLRAALLFSALFLFVGCRGSAPKTLIISEGAYSSSPALVTQISIGDLNVLKTPRVVTGEAEKTQPRAMGASSFGWKGGNGNARVIVSWVELLTGRAWRADTNVEIARLERNAYGAAEISVILGPHGLFVLASDPLPNEGPNFDLVSVCGVRTPMADSNIQAEIEEHAQLKRALARVYPPVSSEDSTCPEPEQ